MRYSDADAFANGIHNCRAVFAVEGRGAFQARISLARINDLHMALVTETLPRRTVLSFAPDRLFFRIVAAHDRPKTRNGVQDESGTIMVSPGLPEVEETIEGPSISRSLSLPLPVMLAQAQTLFDEAPPFLLGRKTPIRPQADVLTRLTALHRAMMRMATSLPVASLGGQRIAAMNMAMCNLLTEILAHSVADQPGRHLRRRQAAMRAVTDYIHANEDRPIALVELCEVGGCSAKSLETLFLHCVGETPHRYLRRWRLWRAREALSSADPACSTVSEIAVACGFWELGRFAVSYRQLFGESPSRTLKSGRGAAADLSYRPLTKTA